MADTGPECEAIITGLTSQSALAAAGLAGGMTLVAGCSPRVLIVA